LACSGPQHLEEEMIARVFSDTVKRVRDLGKRCRRQRVALLGPVEPDDPKTACRCLDQ